MWQRLVAPASTPAAVASRISGAVADIVRQPYVARRLADVGLEAVGSTIWGRFCGRTGRGGGKWLGRRGLGRIK